MQAGSEGEARQRPFEYTGIERQLDIEFALLELFAMYAVPARGQASRASSDLAR